MRVVLDTNIFVRAFITPRGISGRIIRHQHLFTVVTSAEIISELRQALDYAHIEKAYDFSYQDTIDFIRLIRYDSQVVSIQESIQGVSSDPDDDKFLSCALAGNADVIVSADSDLYELLTFQNIPILQPHQFLDQLNNS